MDEFCGTCLQKCGVGDWGGCSSDIIVTGVVIALLSVLKSKSKEISLDL